MIKQGPGRCELPQLVIVCKMVLSLQSTEDPPCLAWRLIVKIKVHLLLSENAFALARARLKSILHRSARALLALMQMFCP